MIYAIGDIHGQREQLLAAHATIAADREAQGVDAARIVHIGDLVDRGPDAKGVVQYLMDGIENGEDWVVLRGNHDQLFVEFLQGGDGTHPLVRKGIN